jgi:hypothetical protein
MLASQNEDDLIRSRNGTLFTNKAKQPQSCHILAPPNLFGYFLSHLKVADKVRGVS